MLKKINVSDHLSEKQEERITLNSSESFVPGDILNSQTYVTVSSGCSTPSKASIYISSSKSLSTSHLPEAICSNQSLIERLKAECLLSSLAVCIPRLDLGVYSFIPQGVTKAPCTDNSYIYHRDTAASPTLKKAEYVMPNSPINHRTPSTSKAVVQHLSIPFQLPAVSPPASAANSKTRPPAVTKERSGTGTGRKVCVSGLNISRWSKRGAGEFQEKKRKWESRTKTASGDYSSWGSMLSTGADTFAGVSYYISAIFTHLFVSNCKCLI